MNDLPRAVLLSGVACMMCCFSISPARGELKAGVSVVDVTPQQWPVLVNGGMLSRSVDTVKTPVNARSIVLDDGHERIAIVVVDSCMMSAEFMKDAKQLASSQTGIRADRMLISATHTHSAPASMGCLGTEADPNYVPYLRIKISEAISLAIASLEPAKVGWGTIDANEFTALRRWIRRPDRIENDPFGNPTVRANMHAARVIDDVTGESGPEDPELSLISIQATNGRPIGVLANFSMHYFTDDAISADYFGLFCEGLKKAVAVPPVDGVQPFVALLSHGCSGDIWRRDYTRPEVAITIDEYSQAMIAKAVSAYQKITYRDDADLAMSEARLPLRYRVPDQQRLLWAQKIVNEIGDRVPKDTVEVYAREQVLLHERQRTEVVVQAIRIGNIAIATTPTETYALTGLKLKRQSPLPQTMVIELANGGDGYIPPPEQHLLGGYNTWAARSAGLEVQAEPIIVEAAIEQLEQVCKKPRLTICAPNGPACDAILRRQPVRYWRLDEMAGSRAIDSSGKNGDAIFEPNVVFYLEGPQSARFSSGMQLNRAVHFAGGRLVDRVPEINGDYSVMLHFWNGLPSAARLIAGWMASRGHDHGLSHGSEHLGLGGTDPDGRLIFVQHLAGKDPIRLIGRTTIERWSWHSLAMIRQGATIRVYLDDNLEPEIEGNLQDAGPFQPADYFFGGRTDGQSNWEGRIDEIAVFDRALSTEELKAIASESVDNLDGASRVPDRL